MMHLRLISPAGQSEAVLERLRGTPGVANVIRHREAAVQPAGDVIIADVTRESASDLVDGLRQLGLDRDGMIALDEVAVDLSRDSERAGREQLGDDADAVVWQQLEQRTGEETKLSVTYLVFMTVALLIAMFGVLLDQPILIVGAMVVGPEFGPLAAVCVGVVRGRRSIAVRGLVALFVGFVGGMLVVGLAALVFDAIGLIDEQMLLRERPLTAFIWQPDALSWVIAFLAGVAGMLSLTAAKSGALVGVLVSVTTVPAAANAAVAAAYGIADEALGSLGQLGINLTAIIAAGILTLAVQRAVHRLRHPRPRRAP